MYQLNSTHKKNISETINRLDDVSLEMTKLVRQKIATKINILLSSFSVQFLFLMISPELSVIN